MPTRTRPHLAALQGLLLLTASAMAFGCAHRGAAPPEEPRAYSTEAFSLNAAPRTPWPAYGRPSSPPAKTSGLTMTKANPTPGHTYAALGGEACAAALRQRGVAFTPLEGVAGVEFPLRLTGPLRGIRIHGEPLAKQATSPYEILDCRLAVALDDFAALVAPLGVVEMVHMSMYRPPASHVEPGKKRSQHEAGMAMDLGTLILRDGTRLVVERDWLGRIGDPACPAASDAPADTEKSRTLRTVACGAAEAQLFQVILTPNNDLKHKNHFHLEVVRNVSWFLLR